MSGTATGVLLVCACGVIEGFAQIALKLSAEQAARRIAWIAGGVGLFMVRAVAYSAALRYLNVNVAYAVDALSFVAVAILSKWLLGEHVSPIRWLGIVLICVGIGMIVAQA